MSNLPVRGSVELVKGSQSLSVRVTLHCEAIFFASITVQDVRLHAGHEWINPECPQVGKRKIISESQTIVFEAHLNHRNCPGGLRVGDLVFLAVEIGDGVQPFLFICDHAVKQTFSEIKKDSEGWKIPTDAWISDVLYRRGLFEELDLPSSRISESTQYGFALSDIFDALPFSENAFRIIGAEPTDNKSALIHASENTHAFTHEECVRARNILLHPRRRVKAEVEWIPGLSGRNAAGLSDVDIAELAESPEFAGSLSLYQANAWALIISRLPEIYPDGTIPDQTWLALLEKVTDAVEDVDDDEVLECLNANRETAGIARIESTDDVSEELRDLYRMHANGIVSAIQKVRSKQGIDLVRYLVSTLTNAGKRNPDAFLFHFVNAFEASVSSQMGRCTTQIEAAIELSKRSLGDKLFAKGLIQLPVISRELADWRTYAEPMLLLGQATGSSPPDAISLLQKVRTFSIDLYNDHKLLDASCYLTTELLKHFSGLPSKLEKIKNDDCQCEEMKNKRLEQQDEGMTWFVSYDIGSIDGEAVSPILYGDFFSIDNVSIDTENDTFELDDLTWMTWGTSVGEFGQVEYRIRLGQKNSRFGFRCGDRDDFAQITTRLWTACGPRLAVQLLSQLGGGARIAWGDTVQIGPRGLYFPFYRGAPEDQKIHIPWQSVVLRQVPGIKLEVSSRNGLYKAEIDPLQCESSHLIEYLIRSVLQIGLDTLTKFPAAEGAKFDHVFH